MNDSITMNSEKSVSPMELMGALSGLLIHDLSNHISVISGNAQFAQMLAAGSEKITRTTEAMVKASKAATSTLVGFGGFRRTIYNTNTVMNPAELRDAVEGGSGNWNCEFSSNISGNAGFESRWTTLAVSQIRTLVRSDSGGFTVSQFRFEEVPDRPGRRFRGCPSEELVEIKTIFAAEKPIDFMQVRKAFDNIELLAAYEMIHACGGWIDSYNVAKGKQAIAIYLPILEEATSETVETD